MTARETKAHTDLPAAKPIASGGTWPDGDPQAAEIAARHRKQAEAFGTALEPVDRALAKPAPQAVNGGDIGATVARPAVGTTHPFAVAEADMRSHDAARWHLTSSSQMTPCRLRADVLEYLSSGAWLRSRWERDAARKWTRLPDDQPNGKPSCNCDDLIAARETIARLTKERDELRQCVNEHDEHTDGLVAEIDSLAKSLGIAHMKNDDLRAQLAAVTSERDEWRDRTIANRSADVDDLRAQLEDADAARETIARLTQERDALKVGVEVATQAINDLTVERDDYRDAAQAEAHGLDRFKAERDALTARLQSEHETRWWATYNAALTGSVVRERWNPEDHANSATNHAKEAHGPRKEKP